ncbi:MAG: hypothetical protein J6J37_06005 [Bacteroidaceae bacterium]|nr:hypothetical protein [Bacteroidaceae bacterium]
MKIRNIFSLATMLLPIAMTAQTNITFEEQDYKALGVYDTWEESPFRTGKLNGNYAVIDNHLTYVDEQLEAAPNDSKKILAIQRSRYGSNTFGVRIDLNETFELTPTTKYIHVMVHRPYGGRVMVVGLGKRTERQGQSPETEQFWAMSTTNVGADKWQDVVLPIKGNGGIDIYSLVVVPDCESPHNYSEDAICYIDNIEVNDNPQSKFVYGYYPVSFDKGQLYTRSDRHVNGVGIVSGDGTQNFTAPSKPNTVYVDMTANELRARAGEKVTPKINYSGSWMHGYVYLDTNNDGKFQYDMNDDNTVPEGSEIMAYSYYEGKNSTGASVSNSNVLPPPAFTIPAGLENGYYRMRFKVDWDCIDPAGNMDQSNSIISNGGGIIDIRLNVHGDYCNVNDANRNGEVLAADGTKLVKYQAEFGKPFTIKMNPEQGFEYAGIVVKYGYNLGGDSIVHDNLQWQKVRISRELFVNDEYTIPSEYMIGDVEIEGLFIEEGTYVPEVPETRYETTVVNNGNFADGTTWYTIQIGQQGYVLSDNGDANYIALNNTNLDIENPAQLWCFTGNEEEGYRIYNMQAGGSKVLAAPTTMLGSTGAGSYPTMQPVGNLPKGYTDLWKFADSDDLGSEDVAHAYMYEVGYESNKVNNRDSKLAFWNGGADAGSTLQIYFAKKTVAALDTLTGPALRAMTLPTRIGLQSISETNGYWFNGAAVEVESKEPVASNVYVWEPVDDSEGKFYLCKAYPEATDGEGYVQQPGGNVTLGGKATAAEFEAFSPMTETGGGDVNTADTSWSVETTDNSYLVRFVTNGTYLNSQAAGVLPKFATGTGAWSVWYVHNFTNLHKLTMNIVIDDRSEVITKMYYAGDVVELPVYEGYTCELGDIYVMGNEDTEITLNYKNTTGISNITVDGETVIYDLYGRRVNAIEKGIYIVNGKKVLVK